VTAATAPTAPYDALLLVSFGGPEGPADVLPFLENVTRGRAVPRERLLSVAEHYHRFGGVSPLNGHNRALRAAVEADLASHGAPLPVYWGNRNWAPYVADALGQMARDGVRRAAVLLTSAFSSYPGCRQYREDLADAVRPLGDAAPALDRLRHYFNHPGYAATMVRRTLAALDELPADVRDAAHLAFVTHSLPVGLAGTSGPDGGAYLAQHRDLAATVAAGVAAATGVSRDQALVYCSRSGPPTQPWLEPDVNDHLVRLAGTGAAAAVLVPIGFTSDHMEVRYDLDVEALATASGVGLPCVRAGTVDADADFVAAVRELVLERAAAARGEPADRPAVGALGPSHDVCPAGCCPNPRGPRPALCGA
jgi:ferrochelatase